MLNETVSDPLVARIARIKQPYHRCGKLLLFATVLAHQADMTSFYAEIEKFVIQAEK